jgi:hypothetical protein
MDDKTSSMHEWKERAMAPESVECRHDCRLTCGMLTEAMREEAMMIRFYEKVMNECNYPDVHSFVKELVEERSRDVLRINQKLNEIRARGQMMDGVISSYDPTAP